MISATSPLQNRNPACSARADAPAYKWRGAGRCPARLRRQGLECILQEL